MAFIGEADRRHLHALYEKSRNRKTSISSSDSSSSGESSETQRRGLKLRKQSSPAYLPSITVTRHASCAPTPHKSQDSPAQHSRANSIKCGAKGRQSRRTSARLSLTELPAEFRPRSSTLPSADGEEKTGKKQEADESVYRRRNFDVSPRGVVTNKGDCYRPRSSSSINTVGVSVQASEYVPVTKDRLLSVSSSVYSGGDRRLSLGGEDSLSTSPGNTQFGVLICGAPDVGKTALINQFLSSEHTNVYESNKIDGLRSEQTVSILLDGEESDLKFVDISSLDYMDSLSAGTLANAYILVYNVTDRASFESAIDTLYELKQSDETRDSAIILVGNKSDLVRARIVTDEEGKSVAASYDCKFIETSAALSDHVDELLVGILKQIRFKEGQAVAKKSKPRKIKYKKVEKDKNKLTHTYEKACDLLAKLLLKNNSKSCGNLYIP